MAENSAQEPASKSRSPDTQSLVARVWPGVLLAGLMWVALLLPPMLAPESPSGFLFVMMGIFVGYPLLLAWWLFASRVPWVDRIGTVAAGAAAAALGSLVLFHDSMRGANAFFPLVFLIGPWLVVALLVALLVTTPLRWKGQRVAVYLVIGSALVGTSLLRYYGVDGDMRPKFSARWTQSSEELRIAEKASQSTDTMVAVETITTTDGDWPAFRGPNRDGRLEAGNLATGWDPTGPRQVWRRAIGPGWSSFAVVGDWLFTQEQLGDEECVVAYDAATGQERWSSHLPTRFEESVAGPGPRATPTFAGGALYVTGANGDVQRLDAATGQSVWRHNLVQESSLKSPPTWGFASSPLVVTLDSGQEVAIAYGGNPQPESPDSPSINQAVYAFDTSNGDLVWNKGVGWHGYSSPHLATMGGVEQVLMASNVGLESFVPATGQRLWFYEWDIGDFNRSIQPLVIDEQTVILSAGYDTGTQSIRVTRDDTGQWSTEMLWYSKDMLPYFNDMVLYDGHLYGFNKKFFTCLDAATGKPTWPKRVKRKAQLGHGQVVLDAQNGLLVATTEKTGEVVLIEANPETYVERGRFRALEEGSITWNHPVICRGKLYVRNGEEAACYSLPPAIVARLP